MSRKAAGTPAPRMAFLRACESGDADEVARLLAAGADPNPISQDGLHPSPLASAVLRGNGACAELLVAAGADPDRPSGSGSNPPILLAAANPATLLILVSAGAYVDARDSGGRTPLMCAAFAGEPEAVRVLLAAGAVPEAVDREGLDALHWARAPVSNPSTRSGKSACTALVEEALLNCGAEDPAPRNLLRI